MSDVAFLDGFGLVDRIAGRMTFFPGDARYREQARRAFFEKNAAAALVVLDKSTGRPFSPAQAAAMDDAAFTAKYRELSRVPSWGENPCVTYVRRDIVAVGEDAANARVKTWLAAVPDVRAAE